jgi:uncharacterized ParB-like nuclease family protein
MTKLAQQIWMRWEYSQPYSVGVCRRYTAEKRRLRKQQRARTAARRARTAAL